MEYEEIFNILEAELKHRKFRNQILQENNDKLTAENAELKAKIAELEKYVCPEREERNDDYKK